MPARPCVSVTRNGVVDVLYEPTDKGLEFHNLSCRYGLISGGRGSGKSTIMRWDAHMRNMAIEGHRALLLRRTFPQLRGSHFAQLEIEAKKLGCCKPFHRTYFNVEYDNGSLFQLGHCDTDAAILDYLSQEWDVIYFDELTTFTFDQFIRIAQSARVPKHKGRMAFVRGGTNPIGIGSSWVRRHFIEKNVAEEENPNYYPHEWQNILANVDDNPYMDAKEYERSLMMLPNEALRRAYRFGEWLIEGQFFSEFRDRKQLFTEGGDYVIRPWHVIDDMPMVNGRPINECGWLEITRAMDWGYSQAQPGWVGWFLHLPNGDAICFQEWVFYETIPENVAKGVLERSRGMKVRYTVGDPVMWWEREGESIAETMRRHGLAIQEANNDRPNGWARLHSWLVTTSTDIYGTHPKLQFLRAGAPYAIRTLPSLETDPKNPLDVLKAQEDHAADGIRYWALSRPACSREPVNRMQHLSKEVQDAIFGSMERDILGSESVRR